MTSIKCMKKISKMLLACLLAVLFCSAWVFASSNESRQDDSLYEDPVTHYRLWIRDRQDILTDEKKAELLEIMKPITEYGNVAFESYSGNESGYEYCAKNYREQGFFDNSGTVFLINMTERYMWLYTGGKMEKTISAKRAVSIVDNVYRLASNGNYYKCAAEVFHQIETLLKGGLILQPMRLICCLFIAFAGSLLVVYMFICKERGIKSALPKRVPAMTEGAALIGATSVRVTKTVSNSSSGGGSSGGGSSGGGGGGGFSGGGHGF